MRERHRQSNVVEDRKNQDRGRKREDRGRKREARCNSKRDVIRGEI